MEQLRRRPGGDGPPDAQAKQHKSQWSHQESRREASGSPTIEAESKHWNYKWLTAIGLCSLLFITLVPSISGFFDGRPVPSVKRQEESPVLRRGQLQNTFIESKSRKAPEPRSEKDNEEEEEKEEEEAKEEEEENEEREVEGEENERKKEKTQQAHHEGPPMGATVKWPAPDALRKDRFETSIDGADSQAARGFHGSADEDRDDDDDDKDEHVDHSEGQHSRGEEDKADNILHRGSITRSSNRDPSGQEAFRELPKLAMARTDVADISHVPDENYSGTAQSKDILSEQIAIGDANAEAREVQVGQAQTLEGNEQGADNRGQDQHAIVLSDNAGFNRSASTLHGAASSVEDANRDVGGESGAGQAKSVAEGFPVALRSEDGVREARKDPYNVSLGDAHSRAVGSSDEGATDSSDKTTGDSDDDKEDNANHSRGEDNVAGNILRRRSDTPSGNRTSFAEGGEFGTGEPKSTADSFPKQEHPENGDRRVKEDKRIDVGTDEDKDRPQRPENQESKASSDVLAQATQPDMVLQNSSAGHSKLASRGEKVEDVGGAMFENMSAAQETTPEPNSSEVRPGKLSSLEDDPEDRPQRPENQESNASSDVLARATQPDMVLQNSSAGHSKLASRGEKVEDVRGAMFENMSAAQETTPEPNSSRVRPGKLSSLEDDPEDIVRRATYENLSSGVEKMSTEPTRSKIGTSQESKVEDIVEAAASDTNSEPKIVPGQLTSQKGNVEDRPQRHEIQGGAKAEMTKDTADVATVENMSLTTQLTKTDPKDKAPDADRGGAMSHNLSALLTHGSAVLNSSKTAGGKFTSEKAQDELLGQGSKEDKRHEDILARDTTTGVSRRRFFVKRGKNASLDVEAQDAISAAQAAEVDPALRGRATGNKTGQEEKVASPMQPALG